MSIVLCVMGGFMLCACPGIYFLAAASAGLAIWKSVGKMRFWSTTVLIGCLLGGVLEMHALVKEAETAKRVERIRALLSATNNPAQNTNSQKR